MESLASLYGINKLTQNILTKYNFLHSDFTNITFKIHGISQFFIYIFLALFLVYTFLLFGKLINKYIFRFTNKIFIDEFADIALGYGLIGTGIAFLGFFSVLYKEIILLFLSVIFILSLSFNNLDEINKSLIRSAKNTLQFIRGSNNKLVFLFILLFWILSFLRLAVPDTGEDGYHTDFPKFYIESHSTMVPARDPLNVTTFTQLSEMIYIVPIILGIKDATRFIHFSFYTLIILLLLKVSMDSKYSYSKYAALIFVSAPVVIRYSTLSYIDFFMVYNLLVSMLLFAFYPSKKIFLNGMVFGSAVATKMWLMLYAPAFCVYIFFSNKRWIILDRLRGVTIFLAGIFMIVGIWFTRNLLLTGNIFYPLFSNIKYLEPNNVMHSTPTRLFGLNLRMLEPTNFIVLGPIFLLSIIFCLIYFNNFLKIAKKQSVFVIFLMLLFTQLFSPNVYLGRHLIAWFVLASITFSIGLHIAFRKSKVNRFVIKSIIVLLFLYYFANTLLVLPYGFGWADRNKYLDRVLYADNVSYFNFRNTFGNFISEKDLVATYGLASFYYADFNHKDINYMLSYEQRDFDDIKKYGSTKLLIKGGDIEWFCIRLNLGNCSKEKVELLAVYPAESERKFQLYQIK